jgi:hypothetical protein
MADLFVSRVKGCLSGWSGRKRQHKKKSACLPEGEADAIVMLRKFRVKTGARRCAPVFSGTDYLVELENSVNKEVGLGPGQ